MAYISSCLLLSLCSLLSVPESHLGGCRASFLLAADGRICASRMVIGSPAGASSEGRVRALTSVVEGVIYSPP